tara:strand:+ start:560 stop:964 length:405 start_codon:yes stop_codon:yes gene_type:complete
MEEQLILFVPSNKTYTLDDVKNALSDVYGDIINTVLWNTSNDGIWYHVIIKIKCVDTDLLTKFKADLFDNTCTITVGHNESLNHSRFYEINICSYKYWLFYHYEEVLQKKNNEITKLEVLNKRLVDAKYETILH